MPLSPLKYKKIKEKIYKYIQKNEPCTFKYGPSRYSEDEKIFNYLGCRPNSNTISSILKEMLNDGKIFRQKSNGNYPYIYALSKEKLYGFSLGEKVPQEYKRVNPKLTKRENFFCNLNIIIGDYIDEHEKAPLKHDMEVFRRKALSFKEERDTLRLKIGTLQENKKRDDEKYKNIGNLAKRCSILEEQIKTSYQEKTEAEARRDKAESAIEKYKDRAEELRQKLTYTRQQFETVNTENVKELEAKIKEKDNLLAYYEVEFEKLKKENEKLNESLSIFAPIKKAFGNGSGNGQVKQIVNLAVAQVKMLQSLKS